jgi:translation initiation factor 2 alpha subunit (eIF-2alpha)
MGHYGSEIDPQWEMDDEERRKLNTESFRSQLAISDWLDKRRKFFSRNMNMGMSLEELAREYYYDYSTEWKELAMRMLHEFGGPYKGIADAIFERENPKP